MRAVIACLLLIAPMAQAQSLGTPPSEREPVPGSVREREAAAGVAPSAQERRSEAATVDRLYQSLTGDNPNAPAAPVPPAGPPLSQEGRAEDQLYRELMRPNAGTR